MRSLAALLPLLGAAAIAQDGDPKPFVVEPLAPDPARDARIAELIEALRGIEEPHEGITCWSAGGVAFDAVDEDAPPAFRELVRLGPAAIPALLGHLTDKRRTRLSFHWEMEEMGRIFVLPEIPAGDSEELARIRRVLGIRAIKDGPYRLRLRDGIADYTVTVGDCCFAILGQIVNRSYEAVRAQPSLLAIVSSPTQEPRIAQVLRGRWSRADPRQLLAESLLADFRRRRRGAEERLALYFPDESGPMIAQRIAGLSWEYEDRFGVLWRTLRTGHPLVRAEWLKLLDPDQPKATQIAALDAAPPDVGDDAREKILAILGRSKDIEILLACLRTLPGTKSEGLLVRLEKNLAAVETRDRQGTQRTLAALILVDDESSLRLFRAHMERLGNDGCETVLSTLDENLGSGLARSLLPLLLDKRSPVQGLPGLPEPIWMNRGETRLCDWAAHLVTKSRPDLAFDRDAPVEERDRQIAAIRAALAK